MNSDPLFAPVSAFTYRILLVIRWQYVTSFFALLLLSQFLLTSFATISVANEPPKLSWAQDYYAHFNSAHPNDSSIKTKDAVGLKNKSSHKESINEYLVSEKLDGVRGYWDGKQLMSRNGHIFYAPAWFTKDFPATPLDGELWIARGKFEQVVSTVRKKTAVDEEWKWVKYFVFDLPASKSVFSERYQSLLQLIPTDSKTLKVVKQFRVKNEKVLFEHLRKIEYSGGEGLMLHHQSALYRHGDNHKLLKLKLSYDAEATVLAHKAGKGKYQRMMGSLMVENEEGIIFYIGTGFTDQQRQHPPKIGDVVTYRYRGLTRHGVPKHASFLRLRHDSDL